MPGSAAKLMRASGLPATPREGRVGTAGPDEPAVPVGDRRSLALDGLSGADGRAVERMMRVGKPAGFLDRSVQRLGGEVCQPAARRPLLQDDTAEGDEIHRPFERLVPAPDGALPGEPYERPGCVFQGGSAAVGQLEQVDADRPDGRPASHLEQGNDAAGGDAGQNAQDRRDWDPGQKNEIEHGFLSSSYREFGREGTRTKQVFSTAQRRPLGTSRQTNTMTTTASHLRVTLFFLCSKTVPLGSGLTGFSMFPSLELLWALA